MLSTRVNAFLVQLRQAQLLEPGQLEQAPQLPQARGEEPLPLAKELVLRGWLTAYQAKQLLEGKGANLAFGPYRLLDLLGEGGMGQVFRAYQQSLGRVVALKVIKGEHLGSATVVQRFCQEIRAASQLDHPNVVKAYDAGQVGGSYFFAMEYVEGVDLARLVKQSGPLSVAFSCDYIRQAALGLQHAHERGLVHRDIKPANLLLARSAGGNGAGTIKVLDMGLARVQSDEPTDGLTRIGTIVGTPDFLAPEQAVNSRGVDGRTDLYSLGCTFYYLLTGGAPFRGESMIDLVLKHRVDEAAPLDKFRSDVPPAVQAIVRKLLSKRPDDRYQTCADLAAALQAAIRGKTADSTSASPTGIATAPKTARKPGASGTAVRLPARRNRWPLAQMPRRRLVAVVACLGLSIVAGLIIAVGLSRDAGQSVAQSPQPDASPETRRDRPPSTTPSPDRPSPAGTWKWTTPGREKDSPPREWTLKVKKEGDRWTGTLSINLFNKEYPVQDLSYTDGKLSFKRHREKAVFTYEGTVEPGAIRGTMGPEGSADRHVWEAKRANE